MEFFRIRRDIPFMRHALVFNVISFITFLLAVVPCDRGLHLGVDFTGGTVMEVHYRAGGRTSTRSARPCRSLGFADASGAELRHLAATC